MSFASDAKGFWISTELSRQLKSKSGKTCIQQLICMNHWRCLGWGLCSLAPHHSTSTCILHLCYWGNIEIQTWMTDTFCWLLPSWCLAPCGLHALSTEQAGSCIRSAVVTFDQGIINGLRCCTWHSPSLLPLLDSACFLPSNRCFFCRMLRLPAVHLWIKQTF